MRRIDYINIQGDAAHLPLADECIDAIVTDPPYELGFMGKSWDKSGAAYSVDLWREALRVLKPGGHLLAFGGTRTYHRLACAIEDAGFEIRDQIQWIYGSGFPKSLDVSKAIDKMHGVEREIIGQKYQGLGNGSTNGVYSDYTASHEGLPVTTPATHEAKQWQGFGTALKPANEPICLARKPLEKGLNVAQNVLKYGTGSLNIDGCRVGTESRTYNGSGAQPSKLNNHAKGDTGIGLMDGSGKDLTFTVNGRFPANVIHDGSDEVEAEFAKYGEKKGWSSQNHNSFNPYGGNALNKSTSERNGYHEGFNDSGSASRFFYCAKASKKDRGAGNNHPTVKPESLMRYLCRLITPPKGIILDMFAGSGSTGKGAIIEGFRFVGIDLEIEYIEFSKFRTKRANCEPCDIPRIVTNEKPMPLFEMENL
jgi:DNA modification methylase